MTPPGAVRLPPALVATMNALLIVHARDGRATVRSVAAARGVTVGPIYEQLSRLRDLGLVAWEDGVGGSLRPAVEVLP